MGSELAYSTDGSTPSTGVVSEGKYPETIFEFAFFLLEGERAGLYDDVKKLAWNKKIEQLADLAAYEDWGDSDQSGHSCPVLHKYIIYTYQRLVLEDKIVVTDDGQHAAFNTGLLTQHGEEIFALFKKNLHEDKQPWFFKRWASESDREFMRVFSVQPPMAEYVSSAADLIYEWRYELKLAYDHIIGDNADRFPEDMADNPVRAKRALDAAVADAIRKVKRNYRIIVPQWYPKLKDGGVQFLLPLDLSGDGNVDVALVVSKVGERTYRGDTVLTLDMAYANARLVASPDPDWLAP